MTSRAEPAAQRALAAADAVHRLEGHPHDYEDWNGAALFAVQFEWRPNGKVEQLPDRPQLVHGQVAGKHFADVCWRPARRPVDSHSSRRQQDNLPAGQGLRRGNPRPALDGSAAFKLRRGHASDDSVDEREHEDSSHAPRVGNRAAAAGAKIMRCDVDAIKFFLQLLNNELKSQVPSVVQEFSDRNRNILHACVTQCSPTSNKDSDTEALSTLSKPEHRLGLHQRGCQLNHPVQVVEQLERFDATIFVDFRARQRPSHGFWCSSFVSR